MLVSHVTHCNMCKSLYDEIVTERVELSEKVSANQHAIFLSWLIHLEMEEGCT